MYKNLCSISFSYLKNGSEYFKFFGIHIHIALRLLACTYTFLAGKVDTYLVNLSVLRFDHNNLLHLF